MANRYTKQRLEQDAARAGQVPQRKAADTLTLYVHCPCGIYRHIKGVDPADAADAFRIVRNVGWSRPRLEHAPQLRAKGIVSVMAICPECQELDDRESER